MRNNILLSVICAFSLSIAAWAGVAERVYVSTDKDVYSAGDLVWCSVFCTDARTGMLSSANSVAYVEVSSTEGLLATAKISLVGGRGSGTVQIPLSAATGNYAVLGYTSSERGREDLDSDAKFISVFNTSTRARVKGGVDILPANEYAAISKPGKSVSGNISLTVPGTATKSSKVSLRLGNGMSSAATVSVSVYCDDGIASPSGKSIIDFVSAPYGGFEGVADDKDGETFRGRLFGTDAAAVAVDYDLLAVAAFPGYAEDVYAGKIAQDGTVSFTTGNVYGNRDMVCEIIGLGDEAECRLVVESPFIGTKVPGIPSLKLSEALRTALEMRLKASSTPVTASVDTLSEFLPKRRSNFLSDNHCKVYHLDDYRRFPTIRETLIEITPDLRVRKDRKGKPQIQTVLEGSSKDYIEFSGNMLVMIDGVPVKDVERLLEFDAMLIGDILIYPYAYSLGNSIFMGVVDFVTKKGDISSFKFDRNVVIVDWQGECYPVAFTCKDLPEGGEDLRGTLYWHPLVEVGAGAGTELEIRTPSYPGRFKVVVEGLAADGSPVRAETSFEVL